MAQASVGNASLKLSTNAAELNQGLQQSGQDIHAWAKDTNNKLAAHGHEGGGLFSRNIKAGIAAGIVGFGFAAFEEGIEHIQHLAHQVHAAEVLGESVEQFTSLAAQSKRFGIEAGQLSSILDKQSKVIFSVVNGNELLGKTFTRIGLNAEELSKKGKIDAFKDIADHLKAIKNPTEQAAAGFAIFGKAWSQVHNLADKGSEGIDKATQKLLGMGIAIKDGDVGRIMSAAGAVKEIKMQMEGFGNKMAIAVAPMVKVVFSTLSEGLAFVAPLLNTYFRAVSWWWELLADAFQSVRKAFFELAGWISRGLGLDKITSELVSLEDTLTEIGKSIATPLAYLWDVLRQGFGFFLDYAKQGIVALLGIIKDAVDGFASFGVLSREKANGTIAGINRLIGNITIAPEFNKFVTDLKNTKLGDSAKAVTDWFDKRKNKKDGHEHEKPEPVEPNLDAPKEEKEIKQRMQKEMTIAAMLQGSAELASLESKLHNYAVTGVDGDDVAKQQLDVQKQLLAEQKKGNDLKKEGNDKLSELVDD